MPIDNLKVCKLPGAPSFAPLRRAGFETIQQRTTKPRRPLRSTDTSAKPRRRCPIMRMMRRRYAARRALARAAASYRSIHAATGCPCGRLQSWQQATRFSHVERPPRERGMTWSSVNSPPSAPPRSTGSVAVAQQDVLPRKRAWSGAESAGTPADGSRSASRHSPGGVQISAPCSSSVRATPFSTSTSARRAPQILIGS